MCSGRVLLSGTQWRADSYRDPDSLPDASGMSDTCVLLDPKVVGHNSVLTLWNVLRLIHGAFEATRVT